MSRMSNLVLTHVSYSVNQKSWVLTNVTYSVYPTFLSNCAGYMSKYSITHPTHYPVNL